MKYVSQVYTDGTECPNTKKRKIQVEMKCSEGAESYSITAVEEPSVCEYLMSISCPQACGQSWNVFTPVASASEAPAVSAVTIPPDGTQPTPSNSATP